MAELVEHQVSGYLVQPGDVDGLVAGWRGCSVAPDQCRAAARSAPHSTHGRGRSNSTPRSITAWPNSDGSQPGLGGDHKLQYGRYLDAAVQSCLDQTRGLLILCWLMTAGTDTPIASMPGRWRTLADHRRASGEQWRSRRAELWRVALG